MIETARLVLVPCGIEHLDAFAHGRDNLGRLIAASVPESFPVFPEGFSWWRTRFQQEAIPVGWGSWIVIRKEGRIAIGDGGFKGPPDERGAVEIGYAIIPEHRRLGYAREMAKALVTWAFSHPGVTSVAAEALVAGEASMRVLGLLGMQRVGEYYDVDDGPIIQWCVDRATFASTEPRALDR